MAILPGAAQPRPVAMCTSSTAGTSKEGRQEAALEGLRQDRGEGHGVGDWAAAGLERLWLPFSLLLPRFELSPVVTLPFLSRACPARPREPQRMDSAGQLCQLWLQDALGFDWRENLGGLPLGPLVRGR